MKHLIARLLLAVLLTVNVFAGTGNPFGTVGVQGISDPRSLAGLAAWYDISDLSSLVYDGSNRVQLVSDKSGNSAVNVLCLNGVAGNYASAPDSVTLSITGDIDVRAYVALDDWTPAAERAIITKYTSTGNQRSFLLSVISASEGTAGSLRLYWSEDGAVNKTATSTAPVSVSDFGTLGIRATLDINNGGVYNATFYTSSDFVSWTQLGGVVVGASATSLFDSTAGVNLGTYNAGANGMMFGRVYRAQIYNGINGTLAFDANFSLPAKLATSFTESSVNAATVTINTTGGLGARICGARDLVNMTVANQPILTIAATGNYLTFDGSNDYLKAAAFAQPQPVTRMTAGSQVTWTSGDYLWDGASAANTGALIQTTATPQLNLNAGSSVAANTDFTLNTNFIFTEIINGASSSLQADKLTATTGNAGAGVPNGITIGASGATPAANFGNITFSERVSYGSLTAAQIAAVQQYLARKWSISGGFAVTPVTPLFNPAYPLPISPWKREDELIAA